MTTKQVYRSLLGRALGLRAGEAFTVLLEGGEIVVRCNNGGEANDVVRDAVIDAVVFTPSGSPRVRKDSAVYHAGAQIRLRL